jgi:hypothetical protein
MELIGRIAQQRGSACVEEVLRFAENILGTYFTRGKEFLDTVLAVRAAQAAVSYAHVQTVLAVEYATRVYPHFFRWVNKLTVQRAA